MKATILVVDDEPSILELVSFNLEQAGYSVITATDGHTGLSQAQSLKPDLIILDLMLPGIDGFEVCQEIRKSLKLPILMLTAKTDEVDKVLGLELGADDYLTKPFSPREMLARVKALLRRSTNFNETTTSEDLVRGHLFISTNKHQVTAKGELIQLTLTEFEILHLLATNPGKVFSRDFLLNRIWGEDFFGDIRTIDVHVRHLREKTEDDPSKPQYILTVRGVGYKFNEQVQ
ncbi:DNA-binding response OmpR family regulator [Desulfitispora alkaliphila]|uniref:response regulator n=1 Tax=Desulfitispora alkaliphila TaxID=622674 RepID=UPI003D20B4F6